MLKDASAQALAEAVRVVAAGDAMLSPSVTRRLLGTFARLGAPRAPDRDRVGPLTERETEVLTLIARGRSNAEIAKDLVVAEQTVKTHVGRILTKLDLRDRTQAAIFAYETGLVRAGEATYCPGHDRRTWTARPVRRRPRLRCEREATVERLRVATVEGRLTLGELTERTEAAYTATTRGELARVTADLPEVAGAMAVPARPPARTDREWVVAVMGDSKRQDDGGSSGRWPRSPSWATWCSTCEAPRCRRAPSTSSPPPSWATSGSTSPTGSTCS